MPSPDHQFDHEFDQGDAIIDPNGQPKMIAPRPPSNAEGDQGVVPLYHHDLRTVPPLRSLEQHALRQLDMSDSVSEEVYQWLWPKKLEEFRTLLSQLLATGRSVITCVEGWDAGGKSGTIRRIFSGLDNHLCSIRHITTPTDEEAAHHYLWRFASHLPDPGQVQVLDRSWYGRVLYERVEKLITNRECHQSYEDIRHFEQTLAKHGTIIVKIWLHISPGEQARRIANRIVCPEKRWKLSLNDFRNFEMRHQYEAAAEDMFTQTGLPNTPWHVIAANDKPYGRLCAIETLIQRLEAEMEPTHG